MRSQSLITNSIAVHAAVKWTQLSKSQCCTSVLLCPTTHYLPLFFSSYMRNNVLLEVVLRVNLPDLLSLIHSFISIQP